MVVSMLHSLGRSMLSRAHAPKLLKGRWTLGCRPVCSDLQAGTGFRSAAVRSWLIKGKLDLSDTELRKVVSRLPAMMGYSYENEIVPKLDALQQGKLNLSDAELKKVVLRLPPVMGYSYEENILPKLDALQGKLGLSDEELKKLVLRFVPVLSINHEDTILPKLAALQGKLDLTDAELKKVVLRLPPVMGISYEGNVLPKLNKLQQGKLNLSDAELKTVVLRLPAVLSYSYEENILPKLEYLETALQLSPEELTAVIMKETNILGTALSTLENNYEIYHTLFAKLPVADKAAADDAVAMTKAAMAAAVASGDAVAVAKALEDWSGSAMAALEDGEANQVALALAEDQFALEKAVEELCVMLANNPRQLCISSRRLVKRVQACREAGIPMKHVFGKAAFTDEKFKEFLYGPTKKLGRTSIKTVLCSTDGKQRLEFSSVKEMCAHLMCSYSTMNRYRASGEHYNGWYIEGEGQALLQKHSDSPGSPQIV